MEDLEALAWSVGRALRANRCDVLREDGKSRVTFASTGPRRLLTQEEASLARAAAESGQVVRSRPGHTARIRTTPRKVRPATDTYLPFKSPGGGVGVIHIAGALTAPPGGGLDALLSALGDEAGVAIHRAGLAEQASDPLGHNFRADRPGGRQSEPWRCDAG